MWIDKLESEHDSFSQILQRKLVVLEKGIPSLRKHVQKQEKQIDDMIKILYADWAQDKPKSGDIPPIKAMEILENFL